MKEPLVVNTRIPKFMPEFKNPIYVSAKKQKEELRKEALSRIKKGSFEQLYPLISNLNLTDKEIKEILFSWFLNKQERCLHLYYDVLLDNDLPGIALRDELYVSLKEDLTREENRRK